MKKLLLTISLFGLMTSAAFTLPKLVSQELINANFINDIDFNLTWEDLRVEECDEDDIIIEIYCNKEKYAPKIKIRDKTLMVQSNTKSSSIFENKRCTVIAKIPLLNQFEKFHMSTSSGSIHTQTVINCSTLTSSSTSGSQSITEPIYVQNAKFNSTSGSIFVEAVEAENLQVSATSGSIKIKGFDGQNCSIDATSGSVKFTNSNTNKLKIKTSSGSITLEGLVSDTFDVSASSGSIALELDDAPTGNSRVYTTSGSIFVEIPGKADFSLWAQTTSGSFVNAITKEKISDHVNYTKDINNGGATIILSATSGRITIDSNDGVTVKFSEPAIDPEIPVVSFDDPIF